jgi:dihydrofolate synthase/folylpolyglutamate synthase
MDHGQAIAYLDSLHSHGIRPGLDRIRALLGRLGNPHDDFRSVLIAGTNGKGSVAAFLVAILGETGHRAGLFTSPHLVRFEERIALGRDPIAADDLAALTGELHEAVEAGRREGADPPTYFEASTALAFLYFSRQGVPLAVLEVGMGGRFDSTNVVSPIACAITRIAMDHTSWLGETLAAIAYQKAGIMRPRVPAVIARQQPEALRVLRAEGERVGASLIETAACRIDGAGPGGSFPDPPCFDLATPEGTRYGKLRLSLRGDHQVDNATIATLLAERLAADGALTIGAGDVARGLARAVWPGRIEISGDRPALLLDGAHNPEGCATLAAYLRDHQPGRRKVIVFGAMKDKPADLMLQTLAPVAEQFVLTSIPVERAASTGDLQNAAACQRLRAVAEPDAGQALRRALAMAGEDGLAVVCGSLYLIGEIKKILAGRPSQP